MTSAASPINPNLAIGGIITLPLGYPVSANRYWRSFVPRGSSRAIVARSPEANAYIQDVQLRAVMHGLRQPFAHWVYVRISLFPNRPLDWARRAAKDPDGWELTVQCLDLGNCEKVLCDALNGILWRDDKQIRQMVLRRMPPDAHGARVLVEASADPTPVIAPQLPFA
jgi:crossover junction endodeoxyribonuclease RusA